MIYLQLFISYCKIGLFTFGGGYAALPLIRAEIVEQRGWITMQEFTDIVTMSQMTPGPIGINAATFVGTKVGGVLGAIVASLGAVFPSLIIVLLLAYFYYKYQELTFVEQSLKMLRPVVTAFITIAGIAIISNALLPTGWNQDGLAAVDVRACILLVVGYYLLRKGKVDPIHYIAIAGGVGVLIYGVFG